MSLYLCRLSSVLTFGGEQLAQQFVAALHFVHKRHDLETLGPNDKVRDVKQEPEQREGM